MRSAHGVHVDFRAERHMHGSPRSSVAPRPFHAVRRTSVISSRWHAVLLTALSALAPGLPAGAAQRTLELSATTASAANTAEGSVQFIGTATVIIRHGGFTILTDPNFLHKGEHVHLGYGLTSERLTEPALALDRLPPIDFVLLSHLHGDHFDHLVEERLDRKLPIVTTPSGASELKEMGFNRAVGLERWESLIVKKGTATMRITAMPGRHGPPVVAAALPSVMGSMLDFDASENTPPRWRMYISGDTLVYDDLREIPKRYPGVDVALLHLGGTRVLGVLVTMDAEQGIEALRIVNPDVAVPIHYDDYTVFKSPLGDFQEAVRRAGLESKVRYIRRGETLSFRTRQ
jgi:L-ascorbate metabolism protein UlaG (beta-lactamase superfamily)